METKTIKVSGMTCGGCVKSVSSVIGKVAGVDKVEVSLEKAQATVTFDPARASFADFKRAVEDAGYEVTA